jgi:exonuclease III
MKPRILSWNVRGLNKRSKRLRISNLLRDLKVDVICFQETKVHCMLRSLCVAYGVAIMWIGAV